MSTLVDCAGERLYPGDTVLLLRGKWKGFLARVKRVGARVAHGRARKTAVVEVCGLRIGDPKRRKLHWGPFAIYGDGVQLVEEGDSPERKRDNMAKPVEAGFLQVYRFQAKFYFDTGKPELLDSKDIPASSVAMTSRGFEVWRAIRPAHRLVEEIGEAQRVEVQLLDRKGVPRRIVRMMIGEPTYLPFGFQRNAMLDAMTSEVALEGVVFRTFKIKDVVDDNITEP